MFDISSPCWVISIATSFKYSRWLVRSYSYSSIMLSTFSWNATRFISGSKPSPWPEPRVILRSSSFAFFISGVSIYLWPIGILPFGKLFCFCCRCWGAWLGAWRAAPAEAGIWGGRPWGETLWGWGFVGLAWAPHYALLRSSFWLLTLARASAFAAGFY